MKRTEAFWHDTDDLIQMLKAHAASEYQFDSYVCSLFAAAAEKIGALRVALRLEVGTEQEITGYIKEVVANQSLQNLRSISASAPHFARSGEPLSVDIKVKVVSGCERLYASAVFEKGYKVLIIPMAGER